MPETASDIIRKINVTVATIESRARKGGSTVFARKRFTGQLARLVERAQAEERRQR